jgi:hypothetical protein
MPQPVGFPDNGLALGKSLYILAGTGDPAASTTPDVQSAAIGSIYLRRDAPDASHALYVCTSRGTDPTSGASISVWTAK